MSLHAAQKTPNADIQGWLCQLINTVMALPGAGANLVTAVAGATNLETLCSRILDESIVPIHRKDSYLARRLCELLQQAYELRLFGATDGASNTAIAALTTINTAAAATDLLYLTCTSYDARLTKELYGFHAPMPIGHLG